VLRWLSAGGARARRQHASGPGRQARPTYAFLYAVRDRLLEIRVTGGEPSDNVLAFVDALLPKMIQPAATR
jgi:hypothetical protein